MKKKTLSYVLTTYNKLEYLKITLPVLLENVKEDEEVIITDGGSNDGTGDFLKELLISKSIDAYVSERDLGEAHGFNKGILMAQGEIIKLLSDDDAYYFPAIEACKHYMLGNPQCHVLNSNGGWAELKKNSIIDDFTKTHENFFIENWLTKGHPFAHCGLGLMLRKDALPLLGLFGVGFNRADAEYTLKISALKINYTWYAGYVYTRILNKDSNSLTLNEKIGMETARLNAYYGFDIDKIYNADEQVQSKSLFQFWRSLKMALKKILYKKQIDRQLVVNQYNESEEFNVVFSSALKWLNDKNEIVHQFLKKSE